MDSSPTDNQGIRPLMYMCEKQNFRTERAGHTDGQIASGDSIWTEHVGHKSD